MKLNETKTFLRIPVIYGIQNIESGKWYIGSCYDMKDRFQRHRYYLRHNMHHSAKLQRSYNKHGEEAFNVQILKFLSEEELKDRFTIEEEYIKKYDSMENGYNVIDKCPIVEKFTLSEEAKKNLAKYVETVKKSVIAINRFTGAIEGTFSSVTDAASVYHTSSSNISRACKGHFNYIKDRVFVYTKDFDETKDYRVQHHMLGVPKSEEWKRKAKASNKRKVLINKVDLDGTVICSYSSITEATEQNHFCSIDWLRYRIAKGESIDGFKYVRSADKPAA